jgi:hypothetical protein
VKIVSSLFGDLKRNPFLPSNLHAAYHDFFWGLDRPYPNGIMEGTTVVRLQRRLNSRHTNNDGGSYGFALYVVCGPLIHYLI